MTPTGRALLGAAIGSLVTLFIHPASRPFLTGVAAWGNPAAIRNCVDANASKLKPPETLPDASLWMQLALHRIVMHDRLTPRERATLLAIAEGAAKKNRTNAFWPIMEAVIFYDEGKLQDATDAWVRASLCPTWDDFQLERLGAARNRIIRKTGVRQAWQLAYLYYARADDAAYCLLPLAHAILSRADYNTLPGLQIRLATLINGDVICRFARSIRLSVAAMDIIDLTTYPSETVMYAPSSSLSPKLLNSGQGKVEANLVSIMHKPDLADQARAIFKNAESLRALEIHPSSDQNTQLLAFATVVCSSVAGGLAVVAAVGLLVWCVGWLVSWRLAREKDVKPMVAASIALGFGGLVDVLTGYWPAALASVLCAAFLTVAPDRSRKSRPNDLGPLFEFTAVLLGLICSLLLLTYLIGTTLPADTVFPSLGIPAEFFVRPRFAGLAAVSFGLVLLVAPIWAVVHRVGTPHVLSLILMRFGRFVAIGGLSLSIVLGPLAVYADRHLEGTFGELVGNEPLHYYIKQ